jgi:hypothetical protein
LGEVENPSILKKRRSHPNTLLAAPPAAAHYRESDLVRWHKTDLPMQSPHVRCWGNNGSRISVLRLVFRRRMSLARRKLEQRGSRACPNLLALLASQSAGKIVHACRRYVAQRT